MSENMFANLISFKKEIDYDDVMNAHFYNYRTEILDIDEGWIYAKLKNGKQGRKLRKYLEKRYYDLIHYWRPKLNNIAACEASRWKGYLYLQKEYAKINSVFGLVVDNTPFCCFRERDGLPAWVEFPHSESAKETRGVSWDWWSYSYRNKDKTLVPDSPLKQEIGDAWFDYEKRSREIRFRYGCVQQVFMESIRLKFADLFYQSDFRDTQYRLLINKREYFIGLKNNQFDVLIFPENIKTIEIK